MTAISDRHEPYQQNIVHICFSYHVCIHIHLYIIYIYMYIYIHVYSNVFSIFSKTILSCIHFIYVFGTSLISSIDFRQVEMDNQQGKPRWLVPRPWRWMRSLHDAEKSMTDGAGLCRSLSIWLLFQEVLFVFGRNREAKRGWWCFSTSAVELWCLFCVYPK